jgi:hypothetical protein
MDRRETNLGSRADMSVISFSGKAVSVLAFSSTKYGREKFVPGMTGGGSGTGREFSIFELANRLNNPGGPNTSGLEIWTEIRSPCRNFAEGRPILQVQTRRRNLRRHHRATTG